MRMIGADLNFELTDPHENDGDIYIGAALARPGLSLPSDHYEMMHAFVCGACLRAHNTFDKWWKGVYTDDYGDIDDEAHVQAATVINETTTTIP